MRPQLLFVLVFFFWPASQAGVPNRVERRRFWHVERICGTAELFNVVGRQHLSQLIQCHILFFDAGRGLAIALLLAVMAHGVIRGAGKYKPLLIWPYAVAPVVAGVLWVFRFFSPVGVISFALQSVEIQ